MELYIEVEVEGVKVTISAKSEMSNYNDESLNVERPESAEDFVETFEALFAPSVLSYEEFKTEIDAMYVEFDMEMDLTDAEMQAAYKELWPISFK